MDSVDTNCACQLQLNPDITGIGVRVALYAQILLGWFMSLIWRETFSENSRAAYMTALALLIASFIELQTQTLSLLDGLVVSFISTMMITFAIASYSRLDPSPHEKNESVDRKPSYTRWFMQFCFVVFWGAWCFNMWRDPAHFGLKDDAANCDTNYKVTIQLFKQVNATDPSVRRAALALVAVGFFIAFLSLFMTLEEFTAPIFWAVKKYKDRKKQATEQGTNNQETDDSQLHERGLVKYKDSPVLQAIHVVFQLLAVGTFIFLIYVTEQTISQNDHDRTTRDWSYGQTIALILLLQQIMQLFSAFVEQKDKAQTEEEKQKHANGDFAGSSAFEMGTQTAYQNDANVNPGPATPSDTK